MSSMQQTVKPSTKSSKPHRSFFSDIKNVKRNLDIVRSSPYASLKFKLFLQRIIVSLLTLFLIYRFYIIIIGYRAGSGLMIMIGRTFFLLILIIIIYRMFGTLKPLKDSIKIYETHPQHQDYKKLDVKMEVDDILNHFDDKGKRINSYDDYKRDDDKGGYN